MANLIEIPCPDCDKRMKFPEEMAGKKVRCKGCGHVFRVEGPDEDEDEKPVKSRSARGKPNPKTSVKAKPPAKGKANPKAPARPKAKGGDDEDDANPYGMTDDYLGQRCPYCAQPMEDGDVICLECGYNTSTRERHSTRTVAERTFWDWLLWLFPGIIGIFVTVTLLSFDTWFILWLPKDMDPDDWMANDNFRKGIKLWTVIGTLFAIAPIVIFAFKRFVFSPVPPERSKPLDFNLFLSVIGGMVFGTLLMFGAISIILILLLNGFFPGWLIWLLCWSMFSGGYGAIQTAVRFSKPT